MAWEIRRRPSPVFSVTPRVRVQLWSGEMIPGAIPDLEYALEKGAIPTNRRCCLQRKTQSPSHQEYAEKTQKPEYFTRRIGF